MAERRTKLRLQSIAASCGKNVQNRCRSALSHLLVFFGSKRPGQATISDYNVSGHTQRYYGKLAQSVSWHAIRFRRI